MSKNCFNCNSQMIGGFKLKMDDAPFAKAIIHKKKMNLKTEAWICPKCGKIDLYSDEFIKLEKERG